MNNNSAANTCHQPSTARPIAPVPATVPTTALAIASTSHGTDSTLASSNRRETIPWHNDGLNDGPSSNTLLITWLREERNYSRWRGGDSQTGESKEVLCNEILQIFRENGINHRVSRDIRNRVQILQTSFRKAVDWKSQTGKGIIDRMNEEGASENDIDRTINDALRKICKYYFDLEEVMGSRPNIWPSFPNSSEEPINARELFFPTPPAAVEDANASDTDEDASQAPTLSPQRPLSAASTQERPSKRSRKALEDTLAAILSKQEEAGEKRLALEVRRLEVEERRAEAEERRAEAAQRLQERKADEAREERKEQRKMQKLQMELTMALLWKSLGMSSEEILQRMNTLWE